MFNDTVKLRKPCLKGPFVYMNQRKLDVFVLTEMISVKTVKEYGKRVDLLVANYLTKPYQGRGTPL